MIRRSIRRVKSSATTLKSSFYDSEIQKFVVGFAEAGPRMIDSYLYYWKEYRFIAYFILYSFAMSITLAWMVIFVDDFMLISVIGLGYSISAACFFFWMSIQYNKGKVDFDDLESNESVDPNVEDTPNEEGDE